MATDWTSSKVQCPYWRGLDVRGGKCYVTCEGVEEGTLIQLVCPTVEKRAQHIEKYCTSEKYWKCHICEIIDMFEE